MLFRPHLGVEFKKPCTCRRELVSSGGMSQARWVFDYCENHLHLRKEEPRRADEYVLSVEENWRFPS